MAIVAKGAYLASVDPASDTQDVRTGQLNRDILAAHPAIAHHVARCSRSGASCWIRATDVPGDKAGYIGALHLRLMWTPATSKTAVACRCGFVASPSEYETHILGCARTAENFAAQRHRLIQKEAATLAKENGVFAVQEPQLEGLKRADHLFCLTTGDLLVDYTVCNEGAKSARHRTHEQLVREKDLRKQRHYAAGHAATPLKTFYLDALGGWSADARAVIKALVEDTTTSTQLATRRISKALMCASGRLILQARVATRIAVEAQRTLDAWSNKAAPLLLAPTPSHFPSTDGTSGAPAEQEADATIDHFLDQETPPVIAPQNPLLATLDMAAMGDDLDEDQTRNETVAEKMNYLMNNLVKAKKISFPPSENRKQAAKKESTVSLGKKKREISSLELVD
jgi:hypothetical protein